jgi:Icc-related predicted phosphoesterase
LTSCLFSSDLHGQPHRYERLLRTIARETPAAVFLGGDLLPPMAHHGAADGIPADAFLEEWLGPRLFRLRESLGPAYPRLFVILGNDDPRAFENTVMTLEEQGLWTYLHARRTELTGRPIFGYAYVPPTPFLLKDWERYDVSRYVDPGCISPEEGRRSVPVEPREARFSTIQKDLDALLSDHPLDEAVLLFHTPPYGTLLDRAALDGKKVDHVPLDVHVGSIALRRMIESRRPKLTLHGHVHEAARLSRSWRDELGRTVMLGGAHDGPELALVRFELEDPSSATRSLI